MLGDFRKLALKAEPKELQRLLRLLVRTVDWMPEGGHRVEYYALSGTKKARQDSADWLQTNIRSGGPDRRTFEPLAYRLRFIIGSIVPNLEFLRFDL